MVVLCAQCIMKNRAVLPLSGAVTGAAMILWDAVVVVQRGGRSQSQ